MDAARAFRGYLELGPITCICLLNFGQGTSGNHVLATQGFIFGLPTGPPTCNPFSDLVFPPAPQPVLIQPGQVLDSLPDLPQAWDHQSGIPNAPA